MSDRALFFSAIDEVTTVRRDTLGALRWQNGALYKYVEIRNTATVAGVAGDPVAYFASTGFSNHRVVIHLADADTNPIPAGLLCGSVEGTANTSYYGWIQLTGLATVPTAVGSGIVGVPVYLTTTNKTLAKAAESDGGADYRTIVGILLTEAGANNKILCNFPH